MHTFYSAKRGDFYAHTSSLLVKRLFGASANPQSFRAFLAPPKILKPTNSGFTPATSIRTFKPN